MCIIAFSKMACYQGYHSDKVLVAAIDFGTTYSGYAFSFRHDYERDPSKISTNTTWIAGHKNLFSLKTPTCVLLNPDKSFHSFGYEAEEKYSELAIDEEHEEWYYFRRFKMQLYQNMELNRGMVLFDESGTKSMPAKVVFAHGIRYLKEHLMKQLDVRGLRAALDGEEYIQWVLTVPAIWDDKAKQFMREAAKEAGISDNQLSIALEPEAAALYCKILPIEKLSAGYENNLSVFQPGTKYIVLDLGGGTVDITVQEVLGNGCLKELHKASGGGWGGTRVDNAFLQLIIKLVGNPVIQKFKNDQKADDLELAREFETKKRTINEGHSGKITFKIPITLSELFLDEYGEELKSAIKQTHYAGKITWTGDKVRIDADIIKELFCIATDNIVESVNAILAKEVCCGVETILMVGGFSECKLVQECVKKHFSRMRIIIPDEAGLAVVKGAVLFGHNPQTIVSRITKFTYGVKTTQNFKRNDPEDKKIIVNGVEKCSDVFSVHVEIDTPVLVGEPLAPQYYNPLYRDQTEVTVPIYVSTDQNPKYTTDRTCTYLGKLVVPLGPPQGNEKREIEVKMTFGGTELTVQARETRSKKTLSASFDFLDP
ncbi:hypothetical protein KUTeg_024457 [Tegillarca granosa]|uniref:Heat shock 70 kDa protein 12A n=1 Tax=Tegillarca granosa TaxID=220873 RepID=A0ABQ9E2I0_TEGGR|nr:hypothetical protein KUTeg_024457 [Tegillarca granosa]